MIVPNCIEWAEDSYEECSEYRDEGYNSCSDWDRECCDWWPCSWGCKLLTWVCVAWYWVSNIVCVAWTTIVTTVCVAWEIVGAIVAGLSVLVELVLSIPIIGRLIREIISVVTEIIWRIIGIIDVILDIFGVVFPKKLRVCVVILRDEKGNPLATEASLQPEIDSARQIFDDEARINLIVQGIHTLVGPAPAYALDVDCGAGAWGEDFWLAGAYFESKMAQNCILGGLGRITGYGSPVTVFAVRQIPGSTAGCSLGPLTEYVTIEGPNPICFAHEIGHALGLWHISTANNLANPSCGGTHLKKWQRIIIRNSKHVTYV